MSSRHKFKCARTRGIANARHHNSGGKASEAEAESQFGLNKLSTSSASSSLLTVNSPSQFFKSSRPPSSSGIIVRAPTVPEGAGTAIPGVPFTETGLVVPVTTWKSSTSQPAMIDPEPATSGTGLVISLSDSELPKDPSPIPTSPSNPEVPFASSVTVHTILSSSQLSPPHIHTASHITGFASPFGEPSVIAISTLPSQILSSESFAYTAFASHSSESALTSAAIPTDQDGVKATALHTIVGVSLGGGISLILLIFGLVVARLRYHRIQHRVERREKLMENEREKQN